MNMLRPFKHFPKDAVCRICGTNKDEECILVPIDGTGDDKISEAVPTHVNCLAEIRYHKNAGIFYIKECENPNG